jgi:hypothetical protein
MLKRWRRAKNQRQRGLTRYHISVCIREANGISTRTGKNWRPHLCAFLGIAAPGLYRVRNMHECNNEPTYLLNEQRLWRTGDLWGPLTDPDVALFADRGDANSVAGAIGYNVVVERVE